MGDFNATITAELDMSQVEKQLAALDDKKIKIDIDAGNSGKEIEQIDNSLKGAAKSTLSFKDALKSTAIGVQALKLINTAARDAKKAVKEFDSSVMDLRMATGGSYRDAANLVKGYNSMGKAMGATTKEVSSGADAWLRQGHSIDDTNKLVKDSMMLSKVAGISAADSTEFLTSAMKGYGVAAENVVDIVDKLTSIDLVSATDAGGLAEAMSRTAVSANLAGISMDKLLGYIAVTGEVTQKSMSSIGEGFKTVFARMSDIKSGKLQFIDEDGTAESLSDVETVLANLGIKLRDSNNEFRNFGDVLDELGASWKSYSTVQQAAIAKAFAGMRQSENFKVLMENYDQATAYMQTAMNSSGTAETKFDAYLDSIEAKTKSLQAAFESLAVNTFSTELFGGIIDATASLVTFLDKTNLLKSALVGIAAAGAIKGFTAISTSIAAAAIKLNDFNAALKMVKVGNIGDGEIQKLAKMTADLSSSQMKAVLSAKTLSTEQRMAILTSQGLTTAEAKAALSSMGLATAEGAATSATFSLTGALKGLWATVMANPLTAIIAVASILFGVISQVTSSVRQAREEAQQLAIDSGKSATDSGKELYATVAKYVALKKAMDNGTGSASDFAAAQQDVLNALGIAGKGIDDLIEKYGTLDEAIIQTAKDKLDTDISVALAGVKEAKSKAQGELKTGYWGSNQKFFSSTGEQAGEIMSYLKDMGFSGIDNTGSQGGGTIFLPSVSLTGGDSSKATFDDLMADYKYLQSMMNAIRENFGADNDLFTQVSELYNQYAKQLDPVIEQIDSTNEIIADRLTMDIDNKVNSYDDFLQLRSELIDKLTSDDDFSEGSKSAESIIDSWLGSQSDYADYYKQFTQLEELGAKTKKIKEAFSASDLVQGADWHTAERQLNEFNTWFDNLSDSDKEAVYKIVCDTDTAKWALEDWQKALEDSKKFKSPALDEIQSKYKAAAESTSALAKEISSVQGVLAAQSTGKSISLDDFNTDELKDYTAALENHNGVLQLNAQAVQNIISAKAKETSAIYSTEKAMAQSKYLENAAQIEALRKSIRDNVNMTDAEKASINNTISSLLQENSTLAQTCTQYDLLSASLSEATNSYNNWLNAQSASQSGDMFDDTLKAIQKIDDTLNNAGSEFFGRVGRTDYQASLDLIIPDTIDREDSDAINSYMASIGDLFNYDDNGNRAGLNIVNFCEKAVEQGLMVFDDASQSFQIAGGKTMEDFAEGMNLALPFVQAMFGEMEEFGGEFSWLDESIKTVGDLSVAAEQAAEALRSTSGLSIEMDTSGIDTTEGKVAKLKDTITELQDFKVSPNADTEQISQANLAIAECVRRKQELEAPAIMRVDTSQVGERMAGVIGLLQQFQEAQNNLELQTAVGADTSEAQAQVDALVAEIQSADATVLASLDIDTSSMDSISAFLDGFSPEAMVKVGVDDAAIIGYNPETKTCEVIYTPNTSGLPEGFGTITRYVNYVATGAVSVNGTAHAGGTAHAAGTAKANGDWGTAPGGDTLVGELGREIVVNPRTGRWYTVGDKGAEFTNIPPGAIVFNHKQTEALLHNGYVAGRATALASGTALAGGNAMVSGGITLQQALNSVINKKPSGGGGGSSNKSNSSSSHSDDDKFDKIDWIEIAIDRIERSIKSLTDAAASAYKTLADRLRSSSKAIDEISNELITQEEAMNRYLREAQSVGLDSHLAEKVRNGEINIAEYDKDTQDKIKEYKEWYSKAIKCSEALDDLHDSIADLYKDQFDAINTDFDNQIAQMKHAVDLYESAADLMETKGMVSSENLFAAMSQQTEKSIPVLQKQLIDLRRAMEVAVNSGEIAENSEEWYQMKSAINDVQKALADADVQLAKYEKTMREIKWDRFDYLQDRISQLTSESDFLIDLLSYSDLFDDKGNMTDEGMSTMGLHGANYNTYMAQADAYAAELAAINKSMASDPYNTDLIARREELLELQQKNIIAAEDEKKAMIDLVAEGIDAQISSMQDLIDSYTNSIEEAKSLYDYQKKISDQTKKVAEIEKQLAAYQNDTSEETKATVQKLKVSLEEAQNDLRETEYEHYISEQKKLLSGLMDDFSSMLNSRLDDTNALLSQIVDGVNNNAVPIGDNLADVAGSVGYAMSENMVTLWNSGMGNIEGVISTYSAGFDSKLTSVNFTLSTIEGYLAKMANASDAYASVEVSNQTGNLVVPKYARGGFANFTGLAHLDGSASRPEVVLNPDDTQNFLELRNMLRELSVKELTIEGMTDFAPSAFATPKLTGITDMSREVAKFREGVWSQNSSVTFGDINIGIDHVENYEDFITKLQHDRNFEKMVAGMTVGRLSGGSSLDKYKYNWRK